MDGSNALDDRAVRRRVRTARRLADRPVRAQDDHGASIFVYSLSPFARRLLPRLCRLFIFFRCTTFIGVCVEFVAAITWLAELFPEKRRKEIVLGSTQAFASLGGVLVTAISVWIGTHADTLAARCRFRKHSIRTHVALPAHDRLAAGDSDCVDAAVCAGVADLAGAPCAGNA